MAHGTPPRSSYLSETVGRHAWLTVTKPGIWWHPFFELWRKFSGPLGIYCQTRHKKELGNSNTLAIDIVCYHGVVEDVEWTYTEPGMFLLYASASKI